ncbi:unnamed protein product, partial [Iphiclides podalirius]
MDTGGSDSRLGDRRDPCWYIDSAYASSLKVSLRLPTRQFLEEICPSSFLQHDLRRFVMVNDVATFDGNGGGRNKLGVSFRMTSFAAPLPPRWECRRIIFKSEPRPGEFSATLHIEVSRRGGAKWPKLHLLRQSTVRCRPASTSQALDFAHD